VGYLEVLRALLGQWMDMRGAASNAPNSERSQEELARPARPGLSVLGQSSSL